VYLVVFINIKCYCVTDNWTASVAVHDMQDINVVVGDVLQVSLVLNSTFHAKNRRRHYTQVVNKKSDTVEVDSGETRSWNSLRIGVPPYIPESRLDGCDMIDIAYELQVCTKCVIYLAPMVVTIT